MPFKEAPNTACLVCRHILTDKLPILFVSHDADDGAWQFLCDVHSHDEENVSVIALHRAAALDSSLELVTDLPLGFIATRVAPDTEWDKRPTDNGN
jgi:hypothetical protein